MDSVAVNTKHTKHVPVKLSYLAQVIVETRGLKLYAEDKRNFFYPELDLTYLFKRQAIVQLSGYIKHYETNLYSKTNQMHQ